MSSPRPRRRDVLGLAAALFAVAGAGVAASCGPALEPPPPPLPPVLIPPLNDAQLGEELVLSRPDGQEHHYAVVRATDPEVEVEERVYDGEGVLRDTRRLVWNRNAFGVPQNAVVRRIERGRVKAGGRSWDCWMLHLYTRQQRYLAYISDEVPVHGMIKMVRLDGGRPDDRYAMEIVPR